eukprot:3087085-Rhodomonas_salina.1
MARGHALNQRGRQESDVLPTRGFRSKLTSHPRRAKARAPHPHTRPSRPRASGGPDVKDRSTCKVLVLKAVSQHHPTRPTCHPDIDNARSLAPWSSALDPTIAEDGTRALRRPKCTSHLLPISR